MYKSLSNVILSAFVCIHLIACLWIRLGSLDVNLPENERKSWMFQTNTVYTADTRSIYDQLMDNPSFRNRMALYWYSMEYVMQTISSVGYGEHSYDSPIEYLFVIALEFCSIGFVAVSVIIVSTAIRI